MEQEDIDWINENVKDEVSTIADIRRKDVPSTRILADNYEEIGVIGEMEFANEVGLEIDRNQYKGGDKGIDFKLELTIDIKTANHPTKLLVEQGHVNATIYVLYGVSDMIAYPVGWEWGSKVKEVPPIDTGRGVINHYIKAEELKSVDSLIRLVKNINGII